MDSEAIKEKYEKSYNDFMSKKSKSNDFWSKEEEK